MIFGIPLAIWFGILTFLSLFVAAGLGFAIFKYQKPYLKAHLFFARLTILLALVHLILGIMLWFFGKAI